MNPINPMQSLSVRNQNETPSANTNNVMREFKARTSTVDLQAVYASKLTKMFQDKGREAPPAAMKAFSDIIDGAKQLIANSPSMLVRDEVEAHAESALRAMLKQAETGR